MTQLLLIALHISSICGSGLVLERLKMHWLSTSLFRCLVLWLVLGSMRRRRSTRASCRRGRRSLCSSQCVAAGGRAQAAAAASAASAAAHAPPPEDARKLPPLPEKPPQQPMCRRTEHSGERPPPQPGSALSSRAHRVAFPESEGRGTVAHPRREEGDGRAAQSRGTGISNADCRWWRLP